VVKKTSLSIILLLYALWPISSAAAKEMRLAIFPFSVNSKEDISYIRDGVSSLLPSRIAVSGKLAIIDSYTVRSELNKLAAEHPLSADIALGKKLQADYILVGSITKIGSNASLDTRLIEIANPDAITPFFIQSLGLNDMLPQLTAFAEAVRKKILGEPETARPAMAPSPQAEQSPPEPVAKQPSNQKEAQKKEVPSDAEPEASEEAEYQTVVQPRAEKKPPLFESNPFYSVTIPGESLHCLTAGDLDGDGKKELLVSSEYRVLVYQWIDGELKFKDEIKAGVTDHIVHIDTGDTNRNSRDEIFVSSVGENTPNFFAPNSFVMEREATTYNKIEKSQQWIFRTYQPPGKRTMILGQTAGENNPFVNQIFSFYWKNGSLIMRNEFLIPESLNLYSFVQGDINNDGRLEYIAFYKGLLSFNYQLCVFTSLGRMTWRDQQLKLGGEVNDYYKLMFNNDIREKEFLPMRILCDDFNRDGRLDVIVARNSKKGNIITEKLTRYNQGEVLCLYWDGYDLSPNWSSGMMDGYVSDYGVFDLDGDHKQEIYILSGSEAGLLKKGENKLTVFKQAAPSS
jgi:TolB-like protein